MAASSRSDRPRPRSAEWTRAARAPHPVEDVNDPTAPARAALPGVAAAPTPTPTADTATARSFPDRARLAWTILAVTIAALAVLTVAWIVRPELPLGIPVALGVAAVAGAAAWARRSVEQREAATREDVENFARILQGFSRAVSPDAIVAAILGDLGPGTEADHLVVVRRRPGAPILDATLIPTRPGAPRAETVLPAVDLDDPAGAPLERIAGRVRRAFGLTNVLAAPLTAHGELLGAILVSRRRADPWPDASRRLLDSAATEASAALARTETHRAAEAAATTDALTGLPNRRYFEEYVALLGRGRRADDAVGILMVDVDRFKLLNDRHGHATGDVVLRAVARTIGAAVRDQDLPARYGGEEFVVLLRNPSRNVALEVAERIRAAVEGLDLPAAGVERVTVSVGAAVGDGGSERVPELVEAADRALYRAKRFGRNRVEPG